MQEAWADGEGASAVRQQDSMRDVVCPWVALEIGPHAAPPICGLTPHPSQGSRRQVLLGDCWECETLGFVWRARPVLDTGSAFSTSRRKIRVIIIKTAVVLCQTWQLARHKHSHRYLDVPLQYPRL